MQFHRKYQSHRPMKNTIFWLVTPLTSVRARRFEETSSPFSMSKNGTQETSKIRRQVQLALLFLSWRRYVLSKPRALSSLMLQLTVSRPLCLGIKHTSEAYDQIFMTYGSLWVCSCGALSLTRGRVCRLQLLLALSSAVILGSESRGTRAHILLFQIRDFPFCRFLRLAGSRWRYSTPPPHGITT
jgi:hypothetical protein